MATAVEVLTLEQARRELSIPASVHDDDVLLLQNINASVSWAFEQTGHDLASTDAATVPAGYRAACVLQMRRLYDGLNSLPASAAVWAMLQPYRNIEFPEAPPTPTPPVLPTNYLGVRSGDNLFEPGDFTTSGPSDGLEALQPGFLAFAHPADEGNFTYLYLYFGQNRNTRNQIGSWSQGPPIVLGGEHYLYLASDQPQFLAPGLVLVIEAG